MGQLYPFDRAFFIIMLSKEGDGGMWLLKCHIHKDYL